MFTNLILKFLIANAEDPVAKTRTKVDMDTEYMYWVTNIKGKLNKDCDDDQSGCMNQFAKTSNTQNAEVTVKDVKCWTHWIHGYDTRDATHVHKGYFLKGIENPAACQQECQDKDDCVYWSFKANTLWVPGNDPDNKGGYGDCLLKNLEEMKKAQETVITRRVMNVNIDWCNATMPNACGPLYNCAECDGYERCIYESNNHIAGPKFCYEVKEECDWDPNGPTLNPPMPSPPTDPTAQPEPWTGTGSPPVTHSNGTTTAAGGGSNAGAIAGGFVGAAAVAGLIGVAGFMMKGGGGQGTANTTAPDGTPDTMNREEYVDIDPSQFA